MNKKYNIAIVGATGVVGLELLKILAERRFPVGELRLFASPKSVGRTLQFKGSRLKVSALGGPASGGQGLKVDSFRGIDLVFFAAGASVSKKWAPVAVKSGAVVIDKSSAFRMDKNAPLVVPEVNADAVKHHKGIIASPNCSTIPLVVVLKPLHDYAKIKRVVVTTFQSVSGAGLKAIYEMEKQTKSAIRNPQSAIRNRIFPHQIAFNVIPQIPQKDAFQDDDYTDEEWKMINETIKIMDCDIRVSPTCVRVPVYYAHSESVNIETVRPLSPEQARKILRKAPGIKVLDNPSGQVYPTPAEIAGRDEVFVGRVRKDPSKKNALNFWLVCDNIRKGAALNAVQIAELL